MWPLSLGLFAVIVAVYLVSNAEARVGREGRTFGLGYMLHLSIDSESRLPLASLLDMANEYEKKHTLTGESQAGSLQRKWELSSRVLIWIVNTELRQKDCVGYYFKLLKKFRIGGLAE